jgi:hypothetical protein
LGLIDILVKLDYDMTRIKKALIISHIQPFLSFIPRE